MEAEKVEHYPAWYNNYNKVSEDTLEWKPLLLYLWILVVIFQLYALFASAVT